MSYTKEVNDTIKEFLPDGLPQRLYKFQTVSHLLHKSLQEGYLWHSSRTAFNDPYDCYKHLLTFDPTEEDIIALVKKTSKNTGQALESEISEILKHSSKVPDAYITTIDELLDSQGICCFTTEFKNNLMWSHYANHHRGVCLVFEPRKHIDSFYVSKVRYTDTFTPRNYFENNHSGAMILLTTKSKSWEYEQEYRLVDIRQGAVLFGKEALTEVIFGCKTPQNERLAIVNTIETSGYANVAYTEAYMQSNSFSLAFKTFGKLW